LFSLCLHILFQNKSCYGGSGPLQWAGMLGIGERTSKSDRSGSSRIAGGYGIFCRCSEPTIPNEADPNQCRGCRKQPLRKNILPSRGFDWTRLVLLVLGSRLALPRRNAGDLADGSPKMGFAVWFHRGRRSRAIGRAPGHSRCHLVKLALAVKKGDHEDATT
jgi:hypothetical protein